MFCVQKYSRIAIGFYGGEKRFDTIHRGNAVDSAEFIDGRERARFRESDFEYCRSIRRGARQSRGSLRASYC